MEFMRLGLCGGGVLAAGNGQRGEIRYSGNQISLFPTEWAVAAWVDQNRALRLGRTKWCGDQGSSCGQISQCLTRSFDTRIDRLDFRQGASSQIGGKLHSSPVVSSPGTLRGVL